MSDTDLARRCRGDDPEAWQELIRRFTPLVYRLAYRMLSNRHEAEDASQEAFMRIHRSFHSFDSTRPLTPWISRITYNVCVQRYQQVSRKRTVSLESNPVMQVKDEKNGSPESDASLGEEKAFLNYALSCLSARDRVLLDLRYREGLSDAEVGEATGMPVNTVKTRIFRARASLKKILAPLLREAGTERTSLKQKSGYTPTEAFSARNKLSSGKICWS